MTVLSLSLEPLEAQLKMIWIKKLLSDEGLIINSPFKKGEIGENTRLLNVKGLSRVLGSLLQKNDFYAPFRTLSYRIWPL